MRRRSAGVLLVDRLLLPAHVTAVLRSSTAARRFDDGLIPGFGPLVGSTATIAPLYSLPATVQLFVITDHVAPFNSYPMSLAERCGAAASVNVGATTPGKAGFFESVLPSCCPFFGALRVSAGIDAPKRPLSLSYAASCTRGRFSS